MSKIFMSNAMTFAIAYSLQLMPGLAQEEMTSKEYIQWFTTTYLSDQGHIYVPEELDAITRLEARGDSAAVLHAYDGIIDKDASRFSSWPYANWVKSVAYLKRSRLKAELKQDWVDDMAKAADLGNVEAAQQLSDSMIVSIRERRKGNPEYDNVEVDPKELESYLRVGAELGSARSAEMLGSESWPNTLNDKEKLYWTLIAISFGRFGDKAHVMESLIKERGNEKVNEAIEEFSPIGSVKAADIGGLPGRGNIATIFTDSNLRLSYGQSYGRRQTKSISTKTPKTLEEFRLLSAIGDETGLFRAYMMVPGERKFNNDSVISLKNEEIVTKMGPGDTVVVRCGPMSHLAVVYKIDERSDRIFLADGLFQYWQPSHNSCVKSVILMPYRYGGCLVGVSLAEITPMIQAVITFRDRSSNRSR
jgi:hypothetical protein